MPIPGPPNRPTLSSRTSTRLPSRRPTPTRTHGTPQASSNRSPHSQRTLTLPQRHRLPPSRSQPTLHRRRSQPLPLSLRPSSLLWTLFTSNQPSPPRHPPTTSHRSAATIAMLTSTSSSGRRRSTCSRRISPGLPPRLALSRRSSQTSFKKQLMPAVKLSREGDPSSTGTLSMRVNSRILLIELVLSWSKHSAPHLALLALYLTLRATLQLTLH